MNEFLLILFHIDTYNVCEFAGSLHWKIVSVYINRMGQVITSFFFFNPLFCAMCWLLFLSQINVIIAGYA